MLEQGVDRIVAQVVDPKINHTFRPQVERVVREFLSPGSYSEEPPLPASYADVKPESCALEQGTHTIMLFSFKDRWMRTFALSVGIRSESECFQWGSGRARYCTRY